MKIQTDSKETNITLRNVKYDYWNNNLMTRLNSLGTHQKESANWNVYLGDQMKFCIETKKIDEMKVVTFG